MNYKPGIQHWPQILLIILFVVTGYQGVSQQRVEVELIDKSYYSGPIFKSIDSIGVHLIIEEREVLIPHHRIRSIQFLDAKKSRKLKDSLSYEIERGYYHTLGMGLSFGSAAPGLTIGLINGYQWSQFLGTGIGIGYEFMDNISTIPVFLELKGYVKKGSVVPFYFLRPGYGFIQNTSASGENRSQGGGKYWHAGVGYQFNFESASLAVSVGHLGQDATVKYSYPDWWSGDDTFVTEKHMKRRIAIRVEITF